MTSYSLNLSGKTAIVTGGSRGIGRAIAEGLAQSGADIAITARTESEVRQAAEEIAQATGRQTLGLVCDVTNRSSIEAAVERIAEHFGKIDILINNAGTTVRHSVFELTEEEWDFVVDTNFKSVFLMSQAVGRHMVNRGHGRIVNIASLAADLTLSYSTPYGPAKAAVVHLTRQLANEWAQNGITVNAISPGFVRTDFNSAALDNPEFKAKIENMNPMHRVGQLAEIVAPVIFFCTDQASYVTGQNLAVDGGSTHYGM
ncbi:SDR family NAD(P)-dependent oxidoreductase [Paenibacillus sp. R14(2021)]|uniref:SDR family NAD(P)-dependent oxidoreductase n=1 Tax=Paenibacillus sp. R14(2021) TaxID=2859228 RepID=UPI001C611AAA|nr:SDR family oxidoreductase [Paenibacillus sp. R14(2021)]